MAIKNIFLDLDDTILDFHRGEREAITKTLSRFGAEPTDEVVLKYSKINRSCWEALERGEMDRDDVLVTRFELLFRDLGIEADPAEIQHFYERRLAENYYFIDGARELLDNLYGKYKLYITSNGTAFVQDRRIAGTDIAKYFDGIFISERLGANKPDRAFFDACFDKMENKNREETIIIGDSITSDIKGGLAAGIHTCHFVYRGVAEYTDLLPEYTIYKLDEVYGVLRDLENK